jgi:hypothetical protein
MRVVSEPNVLRWLREDPYIEGSRLKQLFEQLSDKERLMADDVIRRWALSRDPGQRSAALWIVLDWPSERKMAMLAKIRTRLKMMWLKRDRHELHYIESLIANMERA